MEEPRYPLVDRPVIEATAGPGFSEAQRDALMERRERHLEALLEHPLGAIVTDRRRIRMVDTVMQRLTSLSVVCENLYDGHNVAAVLRTSEGFGLDAMHVIEQPNPYKPAPHISMGSDRWVCVHRHRRLVRTLTDMQREGVTLAAADVGKGCVPLHELDVTRPIAVVFGSERDGLTQRAKAVVDQRFTIPMTGFVESFNVSVSAAITLYDLAHRRREHLSAQGILGELTEEQERDRLDTWLKKSVKHADRILQNLGESV